MTFNLRGDGLEAEVWNGKGWISLLERCREIKRGAGTDEGKSAYWVESKYGTRLRFHPTDGGLMAARLGLAGLEGGWAQTGNPDPTEQAAPGLWAIGPVWALQVADYLCFGNVPQGTAEQILGALGVAGGEDEY